MLVKVLGLMLELGLDREHKDKLMYNQYNLNMMSYLPNIKHTQVMMNQILMIKIQNNQYIGQFLNNKSIRQ